MQPFPPSSSLKSTGVSVFGSPKLRQLSEPGKDTKILKDKPTFLNRSIRLPDQIENLDKWTQKQLNECRYNKESSELNNAQHELQTVGDSFSELLKILSAHCSKTSAFAAKLWNLQQCKYTSIIDELSVNLKKSQLLLLEKTTQCSHYDAEKQKLIATQVSNATLDVVEKTKLVIDQMEGLSEARKRELTGGIDLKNSLSNLEHLQIRQKLESQLNIKNLELNRLHAKLSQIAIWFPHFDDFAPSILSRLLPPTTENDEVDEIDADEFVFDSSQKPVKKNLILAHTRLFFQSTVRSSSSHEDSDSEDADSEDERIQQARAAQSRDNHLAQWYLLQDIRRLEKLGIGFKINVKLPTSIESVITTAAETMAPKREHILLSLLEHRDRHDLPTIVSQAKPKTPCSNEDCVTHREQLAEHVESLAKTSRELQETQSKLTVMSHKAGKLEQQYQLVAFQAQICEKELEASQMEAKEKLNILHAKYSDLFLRHADLSGKHNRAMQIAIDLQKINSLNIQMFAISREFTDNRMRFYNAIRDDTSICNAITTMLRRRIPPASDEEIGLPELPCVKLMTMNQLFKHLIRCSLYVVENKLSVRCVRSHEVTGANSSNNFNNLSMLSGNNTTMNMDDVVVGMDSLLHDINYYIVDDNDGAMTVASGSTCDLYLLDIATACPSSLFADLTYGYFCDYLQDTVAARLRANHMALSVLQYAARLGMEGLGPLPSINQLCCDFWPPNHELKLFLFPGLQTDPTATSAERSNGGKSQRGIDIDDVDDGESEDTIGQDALSMWYNDFTASSSSSSSSLPHNNNTLNHILDIDFSAAPTKQENDPQLSNTTSNKKDTVHSVPIPAPEKIDDATSANGHMMRILYEMFTTHSPTKESKISGANARHQTALKYRKLDAVIRNHWNDRLRREVFTNIFLKCFSRMRHCFNIPIEDSSLPVYANMCMPVSHAMKILPTLFHVVDAIHDPAASGNAVNKIIFTNTVGTVIQTTPWWSILPQKLFDALKMDINLSSSQTAPLHQALATTNTVNAMEMILLIWNTIIRLHDRLRSALFVFFDAVCRIVGTDDTNDQMIQRLVVIVLETASNNINSRIESKISSIHHQIINELAQISADVKLQQYLQSHDANPTTSKSIYEASRERFATILLRTRSPLLIFAFLDVVCLDYDESETCAVDENISRWLQHGQQLNIHLRRLMNRPIDAESSNHCASSLLKRNTVINHVLGNLQSSSMRDASLVKWKISEELLQCAGVRASINDIEDCASDGNNVSGTLQGITGATMAARLSLYWEWIHNDSILNKSVKVDVMLTCLQLMSAIISYPELAVPPTPSASSLPSSSLSSSSSPRSAGANVSLIANMEQSLNLNGDYRAATHYRSNLLRNAFWQWQSWVEKSADGIV